MWFRKSVYCVILNDDQDVLAMCCSQFCPEGPYSMLFSMLFTEGPYGVFAGRDASRALGTFSLTEEAIKDTWDDLSDLRTEQMDKIREWEIQFRGRWGIQLTTE